MSIFLIFDVFSTPFWGAFWDTYVKKWSMKKESKKESKKGARKWRSAAEAGMFHDHATNTTNIKSVLTHLEYDTIKIDALLNALEQVIGKGQAATSPFEEFAVLLVLVAGIPPQNALEIE